MRPTVDGLRQSFRHATRGFRRAPGFTAVVVITLALGIGATTAIFSVVNNTMLRPTIVGDIEELVRLDDYAAGELDVPLNISARNVEEVREQSTVFESVALQRYQPFILQGDGDPERLRGVAVSEGWLETLGIQPVLGRGFTAEEFEEGEQGEALLIGHGLWRQRFGGSPDILGRSLLLNERERTVVGVLPRGFRFPYEAQIWSPLTYDPVNGHERVFLTFARLKDGVDLDRAQRDLEVISERLAQTYPDTNAGWVVRATDLRENLIRGHDRTALALLLVVAFLLVISCVNVANLMLSKSLFRQKEMAVRTALGASRGRQIRQLVTESVVLALAGGALGVLLALWLRPYLSHLVPPVMSVELAQDEIVLDLRVFGFALGVSLLSGLLASLLPKLRSGDFELQTILNEGGRSSSRGRGGKRLGRTLVAAEFALAMILLVGASLVIQSFVGTYGGGLGFDPERLLTLQVALPPQEYAEAEQRTRAVEQIVRRVEAVPGVEAAAITTSNPVLGGWNARVAPEGRIEDNSSQGHPVNHRSVSAGFFETMGIPVLRGRSFTLRDDADHPGVAIVSQRMAEHLWPGENPLGKRIKRGAAGEDRPWLTVVGIAGDVRDEGNLDDTWYLPYAQHTSVRGATDFTLMVRTAGDPSALGRPVQEAVWEGDQGIPAYSVSPMTELRSDAFLLERAGARMGIAFALFALLLAGLGIYGVIAYAVSKNRREWAVRKAIGAEERQITGSVLGEAMKAIVPGIVFGVFGSWAFARLLASRLSDVGSPHPALYPALGLVLALIGLVACVGPARIARRIDPMTSLREE